MTSAPKYLSLWTGVSIIAALDLLLCKQILEFIHYSGRGSAAMWVATTIYAIAFASVPVAFWTVRSYAKARPRLKSPLLFVARFPLVLLVALLLSYFVLKLSS